MFLTFLLLVSVLSFPRYLDRFSLFRSCTRSNYGCETDSGLVLTLFFNWTSTFLVKRPFTSQKKKNKAKNNKKNDDGDDDNNSNQFPTFLQRAMEKLQGDGFRTRGLYGLLCVQINEYIARENIEQSLLRFRWKTYPYEDAHLLI